MRAWINRQTPRTDPTVPLSSGLWQMCILRFVLKSPISFYLNAVFSRSVKTSFVVTFYLYFGPAL